MKAKFALGIAGVGLVVLGFFAGFVVPRASAHQSGCHSQHTCPSDHHTYVWTDLTTGLRWDCAEPSASEYDPSRDTTFIVYEGLPYYCRSTTTTNTSTTTTTTTTSTNTIAQESQLVLPDPAITPGVLNPKVRQATIRKTICKSGWTKTIRPPVSYTNALKIQQMVLYGETGLPSDYEEDHFVPLELGGAPRNPKNLWPEPHSQSKLSDPLETKLKHQVCNRVITLAKARAAIRSYKFTSG
jgi:hypothetical protein